MTRRQWSCRSNPISHLHAVLFEALKGAINYLFFKLPSAIGILVVALATSFAVIATDALFPSLTVEEQSRAQVLEVEFSEALLGAC